MLGGLRARLDEDPILVVPTFADVEHAQRELAERGAIFGARVMRFEWLFEEIASARGLRGPPGVGLPARADRRGGGAAGPARGARRVGGAARLRARRGPLLRRAGPVRARSSPARLTRALRDWAGDGPRRAYAEEVAAIYRAYRDGLEAAGLRRRGAVRAAARSDAPARGRGATRLGRGRPCFVYGFDDFDGLQLDALETLSRPLRRRRDGLAARTSAAGSPSRRSAGVHQELLALGAEELELPPLDDHYADESRDGAPPPGAPPVRGRAGRAGGGRASAVSFHSARRRARRGGARRRAGARSCFATASRRATWPSCSGTRAPTRRCSSRSSAPTGSRTRSTARLPFGHTGPRPRAARADPRRRRRAARPRTCSPTSARPACCSVPGFADSLEAEVRREGAHARRRRARALGARPLAARRARPARAARATRTPSPPSSRARLARLFAAPYERTATVLSGPQLEEARALRARRRSALAELRAVLGTRPRRPRARAARAGAARGARGRDAAARPRAGGHAGGDPRAPLRGRVLLRPPGGRVPARRLARAVPLGRRPPRDRHRERARAARARGPARPRALPVLRLRLARRAPARAELALERRGGQPADRVLLRGRRARAARPAAPSSARARSPRSPGARRTRPPPRSGTAPTPPPGRAARCRSPRRSAREPLLEELSAPRRRGRPRARELRRLPGEVARGGPAEARRSSCRTPRRWCAARTRTRCSATPTSGCARRPAAGA